jgi:nucleotide-binding universal stress UspA family protein
MGNENRRVQLDYTTFHRIGRRVGLDGWLPTSAQEWVFEAGMIGPGGNWQWLTTGAIINSESADCIQNIQLPKGKEAAMLQKILVPLDGSKLAEQALPYAEALAEKFESEIILLWVVQLPVPVAADYGAPYSATITFDTSVTAETEQAEAYLESLRESLSEHQILTRVVVAKNQSVADAIVDLATQEKVDVIVKTTHGRTGLSRWIFGNVAAKVLQRAPCPVFLVRVRQAAENSILRDA